MIWEAGEIALSGEGRFNLGIAVGVRVAVVRLVVCCFWVCGVVHGRGCLCVGCVGWCVGWCMGVWIMEL